MATLTLTNARIKALKPRRSARNVRETKLKGLGVRCCFQGGECFRIHCQYEGWRVWRVVGNFADISPDDAGTRTTAILANIRQDGSRAGPCLRTRSSRRSRTRPSRSLNGLKGRTPWRSTPAVFVTKSSLGSPLTRLQRSLGRKPYIGSCRYLRC